MGKGRTLSLDLTPPSGLIRYKYSDFVHNDDFPEIGIVGPMACLRADVRIYDAASDTHAPIGELYDKRVAPVVLAWNGAAFEPRQASVPFRKGFAALYELRLSSGRSIVGTREHRVLTPQGWRTLGDLLSRFESGEQLSVVGADGLLPSSWASAPAASRQDALRSMRRAPGSRFDYLQGRRSYDALLREALGSDPDVLPLRAGVPAHSQPSSHRGGRGGEAGGSPCPSPRPPASSAAPSASSLRAWLLSLSRGASGIYRAALTYLAGPVAQSSRWWLGPAARALRAAYATGRRWSASWSRRLSPATCTTRAASPLSLAAVTPDVSGYGASLLQPGPRSAHGTGRSATTTCATSRSDGVNHTIIGIAAVGADWFYDLHVPGLENYLAEGIVNHNTAKSSAAVDRLGRRGLEYPGINQLLARGTLTSLKDSTIVRLRQRLGPLFDPKNGGGENLQEAIFRFPPAPHPITGQMVQSVISGIGLDRADLENVMKSTEYGGGHLEEANEIPSDAHDMFQQRCRQEIWHYRRTVRDMCMDLAVRWSKLSPVALTWRDVHAILLDDPLNRVGERQLPADHPEPGHTTVSASWNPVGNDHTWLRYVGVPYPFPAPTEEWVKNNVGVREVHVPPTVLMEDRHRLRAGALVSLPDGSRGYVRSHDQAKGVVTLVGGEARSEGDVTLIVQRYAIYAFGHENMSRDHRNVENTYLMASSEMRRKHQLGHVNVREGRVTPAYLDEPVEFGGHLLPPISKERIARSGNLIIGGLDHGGDHPTAAVLAMYLPKLRSIIVFDEMVQSGLSSYANATVLQQMLIPGLEHMIGYDPAMNARLFDKDSDHRIIDNYIEVIGDSFVPGTAGPIAFDDLAGLLEVQDDFLSGRPPMPGLMVTENCVQVRKTLQDLTWRMVRHQRGNWMVDVGDALKLMGSLVKRGYVDAGVVGDIDMTPRRAYTDRWSDGSPVGSGRRVQYVAGLME